MSYRINTNVAAMNAFRNLGLTGAELNKSITRLSTGLRINNGSDDPSGLIASENFRAQLTSMDAALRNNQDAVNYAKTADGALDEVSRLLREARALAVANGSSSTSAAQKAANQAQLNNIAASIDRIASTTQFGTRKLLDGSAGAVATVNQPGNVASAFMSGTIGNGVAMNASGAIGVNVTTAAARATVTGTAAYSAGTVLVGAGSFSINGKTFTTTATTTRDELVSMINAAQGETGVTASVNTSNNIVLTSDAYGTDAKIYLTTTAGQINSAAGSTSAAGTNAVATITYDGNTYAFSSGQGLTLKDANGNQITLTVAGNTVSNLGNAVQLMVGSTSFQIGANAGQTATLSLGNFSASTLGVSGLDISGSDMSSALNAIDSAISTVSEARGRIGSFVRNTLESNMRALGVAKENLAATESAIREIDVAEEMTNYTKLQILQQSGMAMLAQANQAPQAVMSLLRG